MGEDDPEHRNDHGEDEIGPAYEHERAASRLRLPLPDLPRKTRAEHEVVQEGADHEQADQSELDREHGVEVAAGAGEGLVGHGQLDTARRQQRHGPPAQRPPAAAEGPEHGGPLLSLQAAGGRDGDEDEGDGPAHPDAGGKHVQSLDQDLHRLRLEPRDLQGKHIGHLAQQAETAHRRHLETATRPRLQDQGRPRCEPLLAGPGHAYLGELGETDHHHVPPAGGGAVEGKRPGTEDKRPGVGRAGPLAPDNGVARVDAIMVGRAYRLGIRKTPPAGCGKTRMSSYLASGSSL